MNFDTRWTQGLLGTLGRMCKTTFGISTGNKKSPAHPFFKPMSVVLKFKPKVARLKCFEKVLAEYRLLLYLSCLFLTGFNIFRLEIRDLKEIGRGNFGVVSSGKWRDTDVAVKVLIVMIVMMIIIQNMRFSQRIFW